MTFEPINLSYLGLQKANILRNLPADELVQRTLNSGEGKLSNSGALMVDTGEFTGRSPKDRYIVNDHVTKQFVDWGKINQPIAATHFDRLYNKMVTYMEKKELYVRDVGACADLDFRLNVRVVNELPWQNLFVRNMFIECSGDCLLKFVPDWHVIALPNFKADPAIDGTRNENFSILNFEKRIILIGGTAYTGEIKKGIFSALNLLLPKKEGVLPMHCSANTDSSGNTAIFFGLSGTGKTTLSADPQRQLIGDDEHGWDQGSVFNFEGGCYAKTINLSEEHEPLIFGAIKHGALVENMKYKPGTNELDFSNDSITQNIRVSYPLDHIENAKLPSKGSQPKNIFFLTYDAFGVLPPISKLSIEQAMYQFISGFTSKVAGTEEGIDEPQVTFSACYGAPFMPLHPMEYARLLGDKLRMNDTNVWLVNTGLSGGGHGVGKRISLRHTRACIDAVLSGGLAEVAFREMPIFGFGIPTTCPNVPNEILNPRNLWSNKESYDERLSYLAELFQKNFDQFESKASTAILAAQPQTEQYA